MQTGRGGEDNDDQEGTRPGEWSVVESGQGGVHMVRTVRRHRTIKHSEVKIEEEEEVDDDDGDDEEAHREGGEDCKHSLAKGGAGGNKVGVGDNKVGGGDVGDLSKVISKQDIEGGTIVSTVASSATLRQARLSRLAPSNTSVDYLDHNIDSSSCVQTHARIDSSQSPHFQHHRVEQSCSTTSTTVQHQTSLEASSLRAGGGHLSPTNTTNFPSTLFNYVQRQQQQQQQYQQQQTITETKRRQYSQVLSRKLSQVSAESRSSSSVEDMSEHTIKMSSSEESSSSSSGECATVVAKPFKPNERGEECGTFGTGQTMAAHHQQQHIRKSYARSISFSSGVRTYSNCNKCITLQNMHRRSTTNFRRLGVSCE